MLKYKAYINVEDVAKLIFLYWKQLNLFELCESDHWWKIIEHNSTEMQDYYLEFDMSVRFFSILKNG